jgi:hypothetical protein
MRRQCEALKNIVKCPLDPINILNSSSSSIRLGSGSRCELETWDWKQVRVLDLGLAAGASMRLGTGSRCEHETWDWQQVRVLDLGLAAGASMRLGTGSRREY